MGRTPDALKPLMPIVRHPRDWHTVIPIVAESVLTLYELFVVGQPAH
ncbi:hypothetical protein D779_1667 [Imhoffiella purpurea]|uniref:Uncharacterized protein n=1 Tax=Imhoffiella purpurea TaxID=1249627 RepID=W9V6C0_9GAMM|nr:hypothetical protein D779_1667 [Imhoffiella purpurea]